MIPDLKAQLSIFTIMLSRREEVRLVILVGLLMAGVKQCDRRVFKNSPVGACTSWFSKSKLKSPAISIVLGLPRSNISRSNRNSVLNWSTHALELAFEGL